MVETNATLGGKNPCPVDDSSTNPSLRTDRIVPLAVPTFKAVVADVVPTPTTSNLLEGVAVPIPTWACVIWVVSKKRQAAKIGLRVVAIGIGFVYLLLN